MNTKNEQVSSGLVAVAWMDYICDPLVRLSDAEAIISDLQNLVTAENQRKQQLEAHVEKQSAALKLAKEAFYAINIEAKTFMSYENARNNFSDDTDERKAYERAMVNASELTKQALAAIDALKGE